MGGGDIRTAPAHCQSEPPPPPDVSPSASVSAGGGGACRRDVLFSCSASLASKPWTEDMGLISCQQPPPRVHRAYLEGQVSPPPPI